MQRTLVVIPARMQSTAVCSPIVPEMMMNGMSNPFSFSISKARAPSNRGMLKSDSTMSRPGFRAAASAWRLGPVATTRAATGRLEAP